jgi:radical SAM protein with 4Fe4S-binding SPASM domain
MNPELDKVFKEPKTTTGRGGSIVIAWKSTDTKDITRHYFDHPIWQTKSGDPLPDMPLDVQLELINTCNLSCPACPVHRQRRPRSMLTWDVLQSIVDQSAEEGVCYLTICGVGEAALHPDLFRLLRYIRSKRVAITNMRRVPILPSVLISNGIWTADQITECIENPPDLLSLSLAGLTRQEIEDRRRPINLDRFFENVKRVYDNRKVVRDIDGGVSPVIHISTHIYPHEIDSRDNDIQRFKEKWFAVCDAVVIKPTMLGKHHQAFDQYSNRPLSDRKSTIGLKYSNISTQHYERQAPCMETSRRLSVDSDGNVWCGHHNSEDFGSHLGNVYEEGLREIWQGTKMNDFRKASRAGRFHRAGCKLCGGEIREAVRSCPAAPEKEIHVGGWEGCGLRLKRSGLL